MSPGPIWDAVVIGAGLIGSSVACHLSEVDPRLGEFSPSPPLEEAA